MKRMRLLSILVCIGLAVLVMGNEIPADARKAYHQIPKEMSQHVKELVLDLLKAAHARHDPNHLLANLHKAEFDYKYDRFLKEGELFEWSSWAPSVKFTLWLPADNIYGREAYYSGLVDSQGNLSSLSDSKRPSSTPSLSNSDRIATIKAVEQVLHDHGYPYRITGEHHDLRMRYEIDGIPVGPQTILPIAIQDWTGGILLSSLDPIKAWRAVPLNRASMIKPNDAKAIALNSLFSLGLADRGTYTGTELEYNQVGKAMFAEWAQPMARHADAVQNGHLIPMYVVSVKVPRFYSEFGHFACRGFEVCIDPETGYLLGFRRIMDWGGRTADASESQEISTRGWSLAGNPMIGDLLTTDVLVESNAEQRVLLINAELLVSFDWYEEEGLLVFDGKAYRPDDALAEAIRNRSITEPPAWLVEALKDKE